MKKISVKEYSLLQNKLEYDLILTCLKPKNLFVGKTLDTNIITYLEVRSLIKLATTQENNIDKMYQLFNIAFKCSEQEFYDANIEEAFSAKNYIVDFCIKTQEKENKLLKSINVNTALWEQAGGNRLNKFSDLLPLVQLGEIYGIYPFELQNKPYKEILVLLTAHKIKAEVDNKYLELKNKIK